jgi:hypothetical protein
MFFVPPPDILAYNDRAAGCKSPKGQNKKVVDNVNDGYPGDGKFPNRRYHDRIGYTHGNAKELLRHKRPKKAEQGFSGPLFRGCLGQKTPS